MSNNVVIVWNSAETGKYLDGPAILSITREQAEKIAATARAMAPVGNSGRYRNSIHVEPAVTRMGRKGYRIVADVPYAAKVESRSGTLKKSLNAHKF